MNHPFEQQMLDAAHFSGPVRAGAFSWSCAREWLFTRCERACFLRYYLAQGGWDPHAHPLIRSAYADKYVQTFGMWLSRTFQSAVQRGFREAMTRAQEKRKRSFSAVCLRFLSRAVLDLQLSMENKEYLTDPKKPVILEWLRADDPAEAMLKIRQDAVNSFSTAYAAFTGSPQFRDMLALDLTDFRLEEDFYSFQFEQYPVWFAPGLVFFQDGKFRMILFRGGPCDEQEKDSVTAALFALYVRSKWKKQGVATMLFTFTPEQAQFQEIRAADRIRTRIRTGAERMLRKIRPDGTVLHTDFSKACEEKTCAECLFRSTCAALDAWEKSQAGS